MTVLYLGLGFVSQYALELDGRSMALSRRAPEQITDLNKNLSSQVKLWEPQEDLQSSQIFYDKFLNTQPVDALVVTFPAQNLSHHQLESLKVAAQMANAKLIVLGSWSSFAPGQLIQAEGPHQWNPQCPRQDAEQFLQNEGGARILLAGIWGGQRDPFSWLKRGMISSRKEGVHLVHVHDIVSFINHTITNHLSGEFPLCDAQTHRWDTLIREAQEMGLLPQGYERPDIEIKRLDKQIELKSFVDFYQKLGWSPQKPYQLSE